MMQLISQSHRTSSLRPQCADTFRCNVPAHHGRVTLLRTMVTKSCHGPRAKPTARAQRAQQARRTHCHAATVDAPAAKQTGASTDVYDVVVVGAGISGLTTALALQTKHADTVGSFLVTEARERVGGNITSCSNNEYVWEEGPNSCTPSDSVLEAAVRPAL